MSTESKEPTFVDYVLAGDALDTDIDDFVDKWQQSEGEQTLASYLGFSDREYALWVEQPASLRMILHTKRHQLDLEHELNWDEAHLLAARSMSEGESNDLIQWLRQKGYVK